MTNPWSKTADKEWPVLAPGYCLATHPWQRPGVVEFVSDPTAAPHWRNFADDRIDDDPRNFGYELTPVTKGRKTITEQKAQP